MIADIFVTTTSRADLFRASLASLAERTDRSLYRLTVVRDGDFAVSADVLDDFRDVVDHVVTHRETMGLGPSINHALAHVDVVDRYFSDPTVPDVSQVPPFICYCQDDLLFTDGWLEELTRWFCMYENMHRLGFASGVECVEHASHLTVLESPRIVLKRYIRAAQMFARREYWMSMFPIPRLDVETGRVRARPHDGWGSGVDWWFIRNHPNSVERSGRNCLVMPGLVRHAGYRDSTWLARELPESDDDRAAVELERARLDGSARVGLGPVHESVPRRPMSVSGSLSRAWDASREDETT